jgi:hypothetical protein
VPKTTLMETPWLHPIYTPFAATHILERKKWVLRALKHFPLYLTLFFVIIPRRVSGADEKREGLISEKDRALDALGACGFLRAG